MKTKREIIEETASFYNLGNRAEGTYIIKGIVFLTCYYLTEDGKYSCAVGRCMTEKAKNDLKGIVSPIGNFLDDSSLKEEYKGHSIDFWIDLQRFHDLKENWNQSGLSALGEQNKKILIQKYQ